MDMSRPVLADSYPIRVSNHPRFHGVRILPRFQCPFFVNSPPAATNGAALAECSGQLQANRQPFRNRKERQLRKAAVRMPKRRLQCGSCATVIKVSSRVQRPVCPRCSTAHTFIKCGRGECGTLMCLPENVNHFSCPRCAPAPCRCLFDPSRAQINSSARRPAARTSTRGVQRSSVVVMLSCVAACLPIRKGLLSKSTLGDACLLKRRRGL